MTRYVIGLVLCVLLANPLRAEESAAPASGNKESNSDLAEKTQNPVADLISVPFQNNFNFNTGPEKRSVWDLNIQPVIPIKLTDDWNLITRTIVPIINQPPLAPGIDQATGLGDINPSFFLSPSGSKEFIWGIGPTFTFPTASNRLLGMGKYSMGPAAVALTMQGPWVAGALINNQWSFAGWGPTRVNALLLQPFVNYNFGEGWYLVTSPILTANWVASSGDKWTVPLGAGGGKLFRLRELPGGGNLGKLGALPVNTQLQAFYNVVRPSEGVDLAAAGPDPVPLPEVGGPMRVPTGVGVVAMISQEDVEAFWIIHIDTTTGKVLASR